MRTRWWFGVVVVGVGLMLTGCSQASDRATQTAASLQSRVLAVATSAHSSDYAGALQQLTRLQQADDAALSAGSITRAGHDAILATISQVRADLTSLQTAAQPVVTPKPTPKRPEHRKKHDGGGNGNDNGNQGGGD